MGIINFTPDSYSSVGRFNELDQAVDHAQQLVANGAGIIDVGGEPTNPSLHPVVPLETELERVIPLVAALAKAVSVPISVDTSKPEVMQAAIEVGAGLINDVRALSVPGSMQVVAEYNIPVCLMHMQYPQGIQPDVKPLQAPTIQNIKLYLEERINTCAQNGIKHESILIDPGIGGGNFGKSSSQNLLILKNLAEFHELNCPILIGLSRKTFIGDILDLPVEERLPASLALTALAIEHGAKIIRAHDVKQTVEAVKISTALVNISE